MRGRGTLSGAFISNNECSEVGLCGVDCVCMYWWVLYFDL